VICELFSAWISNRIRHVDTSFGELIVNWLALVPWADHRHVTAAAVNQFTGSFNDSLIVPFGEHDPTANGGRAGLEPFKKPQCSSPAAIVTQEATQQAGRNDRGNRLCK
jgi:hypothetical protein